MAELTHLTSRLAPLPIDNVDTDQIIPASYLKVIDKSGLGEGLFSRWRQGEDGEPDPDFVLNRSEYEGAQVLLAGDNFGCGSSREHAPWALLDYGFKAVVSTRFADIFSNNAVKNGLLLVPVEKQVQDRLFKAVSDDPSCEVHIDLAAQSLRLPGGEEVSFPIDPFAKECLLRGVDQMAFLLEQGGAIGDFEQSNPARVDTARADTARADTRGGA